MALVTVAGTALPAPSSYDGTTLDLVDSGRNASGVLVCDVIRHDMGKVEMKWNYLTVKAWSDILLLFKTNFINSVTFFNQTTGGYTTRDMYISDRTGGIAIMSGDEVKGWKNCSLSLIEV